MDRFRRSESAPSNARAAAPTGSVARSTPMARAAVLAPVIVVVLAVLLGSAPADLSAQQARRYVNPRTPDDTDAPPFSGAVEVGSTLYLSGTLGLTDDGEVPDTPEEEARNVLDNIRSTLEAAGYTMDDLVQVQIFCSDPSVYGAFNSVYRTYFADTFPARAFVGAGPLLFDARFEVMGIAVRR